MVLAQNEMDKLITKVQSILSRSLLVAGTGITITLNNDGTVTLSTSGAGTAASLTTTDYIVSQGTDGIAGFPEIQVTKTSNTVGESGLFGVVPNAAVNRSEIRAYGKSTITVSPFLYAGASDTAAFIGTDSTGIASAVDFYVLTRNRQWQFVESTGAIIYVPVSDPSAAVGQQWLSSTNADVWKYSNGSTIFSIHSTKSATNNATSAAPTATASDTAVMMAVGGAITPVNTGRVLITISGQMSNDTINDGSTVQLRYGTGTAPANGDAVTGTQVGISQTATALIAASRSGFCISGIVTGLTLGTAIWIDAALNRITGGNASITGVTVSAVEI